MTTHLNRSVDPSENKRVNTPISKSELLKLSGSFGWDFGQCFFIETSKGNFIWEDPDYGGRNVIYRYNGTLREWLKTRGIPHVRDKGIHSIQGYCGSEWKLLA